LRPPQRSQDKEFAGVGVKEGVEEQVGGERVDEEGVSLFDLSYLSGLGLEVRLEAVWNS
jgi:hypothetical protein